MTSYYNQTCWRDTRRRNRNCYAIQRDTTFLALSEEVSEEIIEVVLENIMSFDEKGAKVNSMFQLQGKSYIYSISMRLSGEGLYTEVYSV